MNAESHFIPCFIPRLNTDSLLKERERSEDLILLFALVMVVVVVDNKNIKWILYIHSLLDEFFFFSGCCFPFVAKLSLKKDDTPNKIKQTNRRRYILK